MTQPTRDEMLKQLADAQADAEAATVALIFLELDELRTGLEETEAVTAVNLREAIEALTGPLAQLAAIDGKIAAAQMACADLRQDISGLEADDEDENAPDKLAVAKIHLAEWEARVTRLRSKRDFADSGFVPLYERRDSARKSLMVVQGAKRMVERAQINPFGDPLARATEAYKQFRAPMLGPVLLRHDVDSPEWDEAVEQLRTWCRHSGYRTDDLPSEGETMAAAMTAMMADAADAMADPLPSAADIMATDVAAIANKNLTPAHLDDYRASRTAVPRNIPEREYMKVQTLRDLGLS